MLNDMRLFLDVLLMQ